MPLRNRMTPFGTTVDTGRGLLYGNRGCLHDGEQRVVRPFRGRRWISCRLAFRDRRRTPLMQPGRYTELFFLDEATALAAGHRPCRECRFADHRAFVAAWQETCGPGGVDVIDAQLHAERTVPATRAQRRYTTPLPGLPDGVFVVDGEEPWLLLGDRLLHWTSVGYDTWRPRPGHGMATVLTPPSLVAILASGWVGREPFVHPSAAIACPAGSSGL